MKSARLRFSASGSCRARIASSFSGVMDAIDFLLDKLRNTKNNAEFFDSMNT